MFFRQQRKNFYFVLKKKFAAAFARQCATGFGRRADPKRAIPGQEEDYICRFCLSTQVLSRRPVCVAGACYGGGERAGSRFGSAVRKRDR